MREFGAGGARIDFQESDGGHHEAGHAEGALETLLVDDALLNGMQRAVGFGEAFDGGDVFAARAVGENRTGVVRHVIEKHGAGAAFGTVATELGAGEAEFVAQRGGQRLLLHDIDAPLLAVDVQRDQSLHRAGGRRLRAHHGAAKHVARGGGYGTCRDNPFYDIAPRRLEGRGFGIVNIWHRFTSIPVTAGNEKDYIPLYTLRRASSLLVGGQAACLRGNSR